MKYIKGKVSVIIPTYKRFDTLARTIRSVEEQTYGNIEILVVDDNEPGDEYSRNVAELVNSLNYDNLVLITQERHINGAAARNAGIRRATGEYIAFLDDDDMWMPEKIQMQVDALSKLDDTYGGVSTRKIYYLNGKQNHISEKWSFKPSQNFDIMTKQLNVSTCTLLLRHTCLDETGYFDETLMRHQEIQLLSYFTSKYKLGFVDRLLTIIDGTDVGNRPSADKLEKVKSDYFHAIEPLLQKLSKHKRRIVRAQHMTEVAWAYYRDGEKLKGMRMLMKYLIYPSVCINFFRRVIDKTRAVKHSLKNYDADALEYIRKYVDTLSQ